MTSTAPIYASPETVGRWASLTETAVREYIDALLDLGLLAPVDDVAGDGRNWALAVGAAIDADSSGG